MSEDIRELLEDLRALGAEGPREAPGYIEERLRVQFRKQKQRRNLSTWVLASSLAAAAITLAVWIPSAKHKPAVAPAIVAPVVEDEADASFYPLPEAEALPAVENAMVVRVQLPVSSLQLMGVPVSDEGADASVQADLLLGQDGLARAVRLAE
jgi:hypothetical protein